MCPRGRGVVTAETPAGLNGDSASKRAQREDGKTGVEKCGDEESGPSHGQTHDGNDDLYQPEDTGGIV